MAQKRMAPRMSDARSVFESAAGKILTHQDLAEAERIELTRKIYGLEDTFLSEYRAGSPPSETTALFWLGAKLAGTGAEPIILKLLAGEQAEPTFQLARPPLIEAEPAARSLRPARRHAAPTISELRRQGFANLIDSNIGGTIYRFAAKDPNLDLIGMSPSEMLDYATSHPGELRIFTVDRRGYATRELRATSERDMARLRESMQRQAQA